jgi:hypothetical protein
MSDFLTGYWVSERLAMKEVSGRGVVGGSRGMLMLGISHCVLDKDSRDGSQRQALNRPGGYPPRSVHRGRCRVVGGACS